MISVIQKQLADMMKNNLGAKYIDILCPG